LGAPTGSDALAVKTVSGGLVFTSIAAGSDFTCAVTSGFAAYCWGGNTQGQLGTGSAGSGASTPTRAASGLLLASVVAGRGAVACGVVRPDAASCWGVNGSGQLGRGFISALEAAPDALSGAPSLVSVTAGLLHACGLSPDGAASCWGGAGFLGTAAGTASSKPVSVVHDAKFVFISAGTNHTCALTADGTAFCWGRNDLGQLGTGSASAVELTPVKVADHP
jgi:alpha-tubulin suppressor-like RCC1 family protein